MTQNTSAQKKEPNISKLYLKWMKIDHFGAFSNKTVGPFKPKMNVVFGKNEAGKTTLSAFLSGVLFGWEDARGQKNIYKPLANERSGSLYFSETGGKEEFELFRMKNTEGLQGPAEIIEDIDKETFATMFALTGDELRSLRKTTDVTAKLLTAGSGTESSPAGTLAFLQQEIQSYTSRAANVEHSLVLIENELGELRARIEQANEEATRLKLQDKEFHEIEPQRIYILEKLNQLNREIEDLTAAKAALEKIEQDFDQIDKREIELNEEQQAIDQERLARRQEGAEDIPVLSALEESALREQLDKFSDELNKYEARAADAQDKYLTSKAAYEALLESENMQARESRRKTQRRIQAILSVVFPCIFTITGVLLFMQGRVVNSFSYTLLGIFLVACAVILAVAALFILFKPDKEEDELDQRRDGAQWVELQDKKKVEACEADLIALEDTIKTFLEDQGLGAAQGSLRQARALLDEAKEARSQDTLSEQRQQALNAQKVALDNTREQAQRQREELTQRFALHEIESSSPIDTLLEKSTQRRAALMESSENLNRRYGELKQELAQAKSLRDLDKYKLLYQEALTRQQESVQDYARLLLARQALEAAINTWESKSQPEVYAQASRLFEMMTAGRWTQVRMSEKGELQVVDAVKNVREPLQLSLGTCQQLYLSLRIALLMTADNVGKALPIMADDILVNFDEERQAGAAKALVELSNKRQVVIFTCHKEIVSLMFETGSKINLVEL